MNDARVIAIGAMRLSTDPDRDDQRSIEVLHAAFDAGVTFLDTADAYCLDDRDIGHNERLISRALSGWRGDRSRITVATKGGMTRPDGRWEPDGRAKHLAAACERSCAALGLSQIDLYQLHVPDSRVPFTTSVRALAALKRNSVVREIGLCNVTVGQIDEARRITEIAAIQVEMNPWHEASVLGGVAEYCVRHRLRLIAYRPLGGRKSASRLNGDSTLAEIAARHGATPAEIALVWLADLSELLVPIPGITRVETAQSVARAATIRLGDDDRAVLDQRFPAGRTLRRGGARLATIAKRQGEVVLIMGLPGAGKSKLAHGFVADGYARLNRDDAGGGLRDLLPSLERELDRGHPRVVLDNTYVTRQSRGEVIRAANERGVAVRCVWLNTSLDDAQVNAATRIVKKYGRLPDETELAQLRKQDVAAFLPTVQFRYQRELEAPDSSEGFAQIDRVAFERDRDPDHVNRAVIVWLDDFAIEDSLAAELRERQQQGWKICGLSWQPGIAAGTVSRADVDARIRSLRERSGVDIGIEYCPHGAGPPRCWCRKPLPGLGVLLIERHRLDPSQCIYIGSGAQDPGFARKLGITYRLHD